jgi:hypothetical protein
MDPLENWQWLKSDVQNFQRSWVLRWAFSPAHAKLSVAFPHICISQRFSGESLHYLADQMLRGCQSADNQFQALQNQEIEDFSVHGSRLPELEAEVVQIQPLRISLWYLISRIWYLDDFCSSLLGHLQTFLYSPIVLDFRKVFCLWILYSIYPCPSETLRGSNLAASLVKCFMLKLSSSLRPLSLFATASLSPKFHNLSQHVIAEDPRYEYVHLLVRVLANFTAN